MDIKPENISAATRCSLASSPADAVVNFPLQNYIMITSPDDFVQLFGRKSYKFRPTAQGNFPVRSRSEENYPEWKPTLTVTSDQCICFGRSEGGEGGGGGGMAALLL